MQVSVSIMPEEGETFKSDSDEVAVSVFEVLELDPEKDSVLVHISAPPSTPGMAGKAKKDKEEQQI